MHKMKDNKIKFILNGYDIWFVAEAPEDITLKQLLKQCDKIVPDYCACGICSLEHYNNNHMCTEMDADMIIGYDSIRKSNDNVECTIME